MNRNPGVPYLLHNALSHYRLVAILRFADFLLLILAYSPRSTTRSDYKPGRVPLTIPATIPNISTANRTVVWVLTAAAESPAGCRNRAPIPRTESGRRSCIFKAATINGFPVLLLHTTAATIFSCVAPGGALESARGNRKWLESIQHTTSTAAGSV